MEATNTDSNLILTALWTALNAAGVSSNIHISNRPAVADIDDFVVIDINGSINYDITDGRTLISGKCVCFVQLFARDIDAKGTLNMAKLSSMYSSLIGALPYNTSPYTFSIKNQVGRRDSLGFHAKLVNLDCLIY